MNAVLVNPNEPQTCSAPDCEEPATMFCASCDRPRCDDHHVTGPSGDGFCDGENAARVWHRCPE